MTARNDITGDSIVNSKGDHKKYSENWEKIFRNKDKKDVPNDEQKRKKGACR